MNYEFEFSFLCLSISLFQVFWGVYDDTFSKDLYENTVNNTFIVMEINLSYPAFLRQASSKHKWLVRPRTCTRTHQSVDVFLSFVVCVNFVSILTLATLALQSKLGSCAIAVGSSHTFLNRKSLIGWSSWGELFRGTYVWSLCEFGGTQLSRQFSGCPLFSFVLLNIYFFKSRNKESKIDATMTGRFIRIEYCYLFI